jgi:hypothetical protein
MVPAKERRAAARRRRAREERLQRALGTVRVVGGEAAQRSACWLIQEGRENEG